LSLLAPEPTLHVLHEMSQGIQTLLLTDCELYVKFELQAV